MQDLDSVFLSTLIEAPDTFELDPKQLAFLVAYLKNYRQPLSKLADPESKLAKLRLIRDYNVGLHSLKDSQPKADDNELVALQKRQAERGRKQREQVDKRQLDAEWRDAWDSLAKFDFEGLGTPPPIPWTDEHVQKVIHLADVVKRHGFDNIVCEIRSRVFNWITKTNAGAKCELPVVTLGLANQSSHDAGFDEYIDEILATAIVLQRAIEGTHATLVPEDMQVELLSSDAWRRLGNEVSEVPDLPIEPVLIVQKARPSEAILPEIAVASVASANLQQFLEIASEIRCRIESNPDQWWKKTFGLTKQLEDLRKMLWPSEKFGFILLRDMRTSETVAADVMRQAELNPKLDCGRITKDDGGFVIHIPSLPDVGRGLKLDVVEKTRLLVSDPRTEDPSDWLVEMLIGKFGGRVTCAVDPPIAKDVIESLDNWIRFATAQAKQPTDAGVTKNGTRDDASEMLAKLNEILIHAQTTTRPKKTKPNEEQKDWEKVVREYEKFTKPKGYKKQRSGVWTAKFEALWDSRDDLQAWNLSSAWDNYDAARKRIDRRSR